MSAKIKIPEVSKEYRVALVDYLLSYPVLERNRFYTFLNTVSGYCTDAEISLSMTGLGGCKSIDELINTSTGFKLATIKEFVWFHGLGYTGGDFQHIFLDAFLSLRCDMIMSGEPAEPITWAKAYYAEDCNDSD